MWFNINILESAAVRRCALAALCAVAAVATVADAHDGVFEIKRHVPEVPPPTLVPDARAALAAEGRRHLGQRGR